MFKGRFGQNSAGGSGKTEPSFLGDSRFGQGVVRAEIKPVTMIHAPGGDWHLSLFKYLKELPSSTSLILAWSVRNYTDD